MTTKSEDYISEVERYCAANYKPQAIVLDRGEGAWVWDCEGKRYLDFLSAYSAVSLGHCPPVILSAFKSQAERLTLCSRAFHNSVMGEFLRDLCMLCSMEVALPMNSGAEAVETAIKLARKWGYEKKGIKRDQAEIVVAENNFHGRTTTIISFSSNQGYRQNFGPLTPGFRFAPFGDLKALEQQISENTAAVLIEPIQAEGGIIVPPAGYLSAVKQLCKKHDVLFILDEIQTGLCRTGKMFAYEHEADAKPDVLILGKSLGGGVYPVSAVVSSREIFEVFTPGTHGSTFGGNPLAAAVGKAVIAVLRDPELVARTAQLGLILLEELRKIPSKHVVEIRGRGLLVGIEIRSTSGKARVFCEQLATLGVLVNDTHQQVIRVAPPLVISEQDLRWGVAQFAQVLG